MNITLTLFALTVLLAVILAAWESRIDGGDLTGAAEWVLAVYVAGGPLTLAWVVRGAVYVWGGW